MWYLFLYLKNVKIYSCGVFPLVYYDLSFGGESCEIKILTRSIQERYTLRKVKNQVFNLSIELRTKFVWSHGLLGNGSLATYKLVSSTAVLLWLFKFLERFWLIYSRIIFDVTYILHDFNFSPLMLNLRSLMDLHLRSEKYLQALGKKVLATEYLRLHQIPCWVSNQVYLVWSQS